MLPGQTWFYIFKKIGAEHESKQITLLLIAAASAGLVGCSKTDNYTPGRERKRRRHILCKLHEVPQTGIRWQRDDVKYRNG